MSPSKDSRYGVAGSASDRISSCNLCGRWSPSYVVSKLSMHASGLRADAFFFVLGARGCWTSFVRSKFKLGFSVG